MLPRDVSLILQAISLLVTEHSCINNQKCDQCEYYSRLIIAHYTFDIGRFAFYGCPVPNPLLVLFYIILIIPNMQNYEMGWSNISAVETLYMPVILTLPGPVRLMMLLVTPGSPG